MPIIFKNLRRFLLKQNKAKSYLLYALGEIILVVLGILIALQVNNWNEKRKREDRFKFGLRELYGEIRATAFFGTSMNDKMAWQLIRIDSILNNPEMISVERLPAMIQLFDEYGVDEKDNTWKAEYLEFEPDDEKRNQMAKALRAIAFGWNSLEERLRVNKLDKLMNSHLRQYNIPIQLYDPGTGYEEFIRKGVLAAYTEEQLKQVRLLVNDPSFIADLMTLRGIKSGVINYTETVGFSADSFLDYVEAYDPETNYEITNMEIIGPGLPNGQWGTGLPMKRIDPENENIWEINQELVDGLIKFRADDDWLLDWGKGESDSKILVFKGGDIPVKKGFYHIKINIRDNSMEFIPMEK